MTQPVALGPTVVKYFRTYGFTTYNWTTYYQPQPAGAQNPFTTFTVVPDPADLRAIVATVQTTSAGTVSVSWGKRSGAYSGRTRPVSVPANTSVQIRVTELSKGTYYLNAQFSTSVANAPGLPLSGSFQSGESSVALSGTPTSPVISGIVATPGGAGTGTCTITWTTDIPSNSVVNYGPTNAYGQSASNAALVTSHSVSLSGLTHPSTYHYQVSSTTSIGGTASSVDATFATT